VSDFDRCIEEWADRVAGCNKTITQQAQELENLKGVLGANEVLVERLAAMTTERDAFQVGQLEVAKFLGYGIGEHLSLQSFIMQQLAASQARCRELEAVRHDYKATLTDAELSDKEYMTAYCSDFHADYGLALKRLAQLQARLAVLEKGFADQTALRERHEAGFTETIAQLQATLAAREAELHEVKVQCGENALSHMAEYHRAEEAVQEAGRLRETLEYYAQTAIGARAVDALKGA